MSAKLHFAGADLPGSEPVNKDCAWLKRNIDTFDKVIEFLYNIYETEQNSDIDPSVSLYITARKVVIYYFREVFFAQRKFQNPALREMFFNAVIDGGLFEARCQSEFANKIVEEAGFGDWLEESKEGGVYVGGFVEAISALIEALDRIALVMDSRESYILDSTYRKTMSAVLQVLRKINEMFDKNSWEFFINELGHKAEGDEVFGMFRNVLEKLGYNEDGTPMYRN